MRFWVGLGFGIAVAGCGDDAASPGHGATTGGGGTGGGGCSDPAGCLPVEPIPCADGFVVDPEDGGCEPLLPGAECPPGTRPEIGSTTCIPVGPLACADGFQPSADGWGCSPILPAVACTGASIEVLGSTVCQPIGDCDAAFPPASATLFVDDDYVPAELDATHFASLAGALEMASPGAVIAVEAGSYVGKLTIDEPISIIGRCAEQVSITSPDQDSLAFFVTASPVLLRGLSFTGHEGGVGVVGSEVDIEECLFEDNLVASVIATDAGGLARVRRSAIRGTVTNPAGNQTHGLFAQSGGRLELDECSVAANHFTNIAVVGPGSSALVHRSVVRDGLPQVGGSFDGMLGIGALAQNGADLEVTESAVFDNFESAITFGSLEGGPPVTGSVARSVVERTRVNPSSGFGRGIEVGRSSTVTLSDTTLRMSKEYDLIVTEGGDLTGQRLAMVGPIATPSEPSGVGFIVSDDATAVVEDSAVVASRIIGIQVQIGGRATFRRSLIKDSLPSLSPLPGLPHLYGMGINVRPSGQLEIDRSAVVGNRATSVIVDGLGAPPGETSLRADALLVDDTRVDENGAFGRGLSAQDGALVELRRSAILRSRDLGIMVTDLGTTAILTDTVIRDVARDQNDAYGLGLVILDDAATTLERLTLRGAASAGLAVAAASGFLVHSAISSNVIGVQVQGGTSLVEAEAPPTDERTLVISSDTVFVANEAKIGSAQIPLPSPILAPQ